MDFVVVEIAFRMLGVGPQTPQARGYSAPFHGASSLVTRIVIGFVLSVMAVGLALWLAVWLAIQLL